MSALELADLVRNRTLSPEIAATLATAAEERRSFLVAAIPRMAGKTTTLMATLQYAPPGTAQHVLSTDHGPSLGIPAQPDGGYLIMSEIAQTPFPHYLWGEPVRRVFHALRDGFSLATALHAPSLEAAFAIITRENAVPDAEAARLELMVYIRSLGPDWRNPTRRVVTEVHEIERVVDGRPRARLLHRWDEPADRFVAGDRPLRIGRASGTYERRVQEFTRALDGG